jgi:uncharacterized membrane protein HdeD (DUF308 family)
MNEEPRGVEPGYGWRGRTGGLLREERGWFIAAGVALVIFGFVAVALPFFSSIAATMVAGILLLAAGAVQLAHAARSRHGGRPALRVIMGLIYLVAGFLLLANPIAGVLTLTLVVGSYLVAAGVVRLLVAIEARPLEGWGWSALSGVLSIVLGVLLWAGWPGTAAWAIGLLVGIDLVAAGWSLMLLPVVARRTTFL